MTIPYQISKEQMVLFRELAADRNVSKYEAQAILGMTEGEIKGVQKRYKIEWLNHQHRYRDIAYYADKLDQLKACAANPSVTRKETSKLLGIGERKIHELVDELGIKWKSKAKPAPHSWSHPDRKKERKRILPRVSELASDPNVTKREAAVRLGMGESQFRDFCRRENIKWARPAVNTSAFNNRKWNNKDRPDSGNPEKMSHGLASTRIDKRDRAEIIRMVMDAVLPYHKAS